MTLTKKSSFSVQVPAAIYARAERFATAGGYTLKSVFETAIEEWLAARENDAVAAAPKLGHTFVSSATGVACANCGADVSTEDGCTAVSP